LKKIVFTMIFLSFFLLSGCSDAKPEELSFSHLDAKTTVHISKQDDVVNLYATVENLSDENREILYGEGTIMVMADNTYYPDSVRHFALKEAVGKKMSRRLSEETNVPMDVWEKGDVTVVVKYQIDGVNVEEKLFPKK